MKIRENLEKWFRLSGRGDIKDYVIITKEEKDRVWGWPTPALLDIIEGLDGKGMKWDRDPGKLEEYFHGLGSVSFREPGGEIPALQVVLHPDQDGKLKGTPGLSGTFVEIDFDYASPLDKKFYIHWLEVVANLMWRMKTNQRKISKLLDVRFNREMDREMADDWHESHVTTAKIEDDAITAEKIETVSFVQAADPEDDEIEGEGI